MVSSLPAICSSAQAYLILISADCTLGKYRLIGGASPDVDQGDAQVFFIFTQHGVTGCQLLENEVVDLQAASGHTLGYVLDRADGCCDKVDPGFQTHT